MRYEHAPDEWVRVSFNRATAVSTYGCDCDQWGFRRLAGGVIADAFFHKGHYTPDELIKRIADLIEQSPIRPHVGKPDRAPLWVPTNNDGYFVITCTECLRSFPVEDQPQVKELRTTNCIYCDTELRFLASPENAKKQSGMRSIK